MSTRNDVEMEEQKAESSVVQQPPSDEVETDEEGSDYGSTFESFRSKDDEDDQYCLLETEEIEKKMMMTTSDQQHTVEKDEVSSDEAEMDDGSTIGPLRSSTSLSVSECRWVPCREVEEYDEGIVVFSRSSSSSSSLSSFSRSQFEIKIGKPTSLFQSLLGVARPVIGKPTLITPPMMISYQDEFKIFTKKELRKVTNNYSWVIREDDGGVFYQGMLDDRRVVAVKKGYPLDVDGYKSIKEFVNARIILSQINHVNVVQLLGCCLEVKPPTLVYEYIPNGTLFNFILGDVEFPLDTRLRMATEAAGALAYLHSGTSPPILHGDVKSSNILLDENYTVKVCGVGVLDNYEGPRIQDTLGYLNPFPGVLQGSYGYLDPESLQTGVLTDKSDVYSFGVVLLDLLTRRKVDPEIVLQSFRQQDSKEGITTRFIDCMRENTLLDVLDPEITTEGLTEQLQKVTNLAARCLKLKGSDRPTMKEVHMELEALRVSTTCPLVRLHAIESHQP